MGPSSLLTVSKLTVLPARFTVSSLGRCRALANGLRADVAVLPLSPKRLQTAAGIMRCLSMLISCYQLARLRPSLLVPRPPNVLRCTDHCAFPNWTSSASAMGGVADAIPFLAGRFKRRTAAPFVRSVGLSVRHSWPNN